MSNIEDLSGVAPLDGFAPQCPVGEHLMCVQGIESEDKGKDKGWYHALTLEAMSPEIQGHVATQGFAFYGSDGGATAKGKFRSFLDACGLPPKGCTTEMCKGKLLIVSVVHENFVSNKSGKTLISAKANAFKPAGDAMAKMMAGVGANSAQTPAPSSGPKVDF